MFEIGRVCMKVAGRDAGLKCVIVDIINPHFVVIAGQTRYRKCNLKHLEPTDKILPIKMGASMHDIAHALKEIGIVVVEKKKDHKAKTPVAAPRSKKVVKTKPVKEVKTKAAPAKKAAAKTGKVVEAQTEDLKD